MCETSSSIGVQVTPHYVDKISQWPEFEQNCRGDTWKVENDHNYHLHQASISVNMVNTTARAHFVQKTPYA